MATFEQDKKYNELIASMKKAYRDYSQGIISYRDLEHFLSNYDIEMENLLDEIRRGA